MLFVTPELRSTITKVINVTKGPQSEDALERIKTESQVSLLRSSVLSELMQANDLILQQWWMHSSSSIELF